MSKKNPIDEAVEAREKVAEDRVKHEQGLVDTWKKDPSKKNTAAVMKQFEPIYRSHLNIHKAPMTSATGLRGNMLNLTVDALKTYDPTRVGKSGKPASFSTHLHTTLRRVSRTNKKRQNVGRIAENPASYLGKIQQAEDELSDELGRAPTSSETSARINIGLPKKRQISARKLKQIQGMSRRDVLSSRFESDPTPVAAQREEEVIGLLRPTLSGDEAKVYDAIYPENGPQVKSTSVIAKRLGFSASKVSRLKGGIKNKFDQYK